MTDLCGKHTVHNQVTVAGGQSLPGSNGYICACLSEVLDALPEGGRQ